MATSSASMSAAHGRFARRLGNLPVRYAVFAFGALCAQVAVWEIVVRAGLIDPLVLPPPSSVLRAAMQLVADGTLIADLTTSTRRALMGYVLGSAAAIPIGMITGSWRVGAVLFEPLLQLLRPIPALAWVPFSILWLGIGESQKLFVIALGVFFPVWLNTHIGMGNTPQRYVDVARTLGCNRLDLLVRVGLPAALPYVVAGLRQGIALAFLLLVAAELTGAEAGLGALISQSHLLYRTDRMLVGLLALGVLGAAVDLAFSKVARRVVFWR